MLSVECECLIIYFFANHSTFESYEVPLPIIEIQAMDVIIQKLEMEFVIYVDTDREPTSVLGREMTIWFRLNGFMIWSGLGLRFFNGLVWGLRNQTKHC